MLERIKALEAAGAWGEIRQHAPALLADLAGDDLARGYLGTSKAFEETATGPDDYHTALTHARAGLDAATPGGLMHTWLLARVAAYSADLGKDGDAEQAALAFLAARHLHPQADAIAPWAFYALARVRHRQHRWQEAISLWHRVLESAPPTLAERAQLHLVWTLAEAHRLREAAAALPPAAEHVPGWMLQAGRAVVAAAGRDWGAVKGYATETLRLVGAGWQACDTVQIAEIYLLLRKAAIAAKDMDQAKVWLHQATSLLSRWNWAIMTRLVLTLRVRGGEYVDAAASHRGPTGYDRTGLRGAVG